MENFTEIPYTANNLDRYYIRKSIFLAIQDTLPFFSEHMLDIGCGKMPYRDYILKNSSVIEYVGLDIENALEYDSDINPDFTWDGKIIPFEDNSFSSVMATEVLEHCPFPDQVLREVYRVLKEKGVFFFTVPFLWNLHEVPNDEYRYTPFALKRLLEDAGFSEVEIKATGGWHASMAQMLGLWVRRSPMKENKRRILSKMFQPVIKYLLKIDRRNEVAFKEGQMITGLTGIARKKL